MILRSHIIRFYINSHNEIENYFRNKNIPLHYKYSDEYIEFFYIAQFSNNIFILFKVLNDSPKYIILNIYPISSPQWITNTNYFQDYNNSSIVSFYNNISKLFGIELLRLKNYKPNINFQLSLYNLMNVYETKSDIEIISNYLFFRDNSKSSINSILYKYYADNKISYNDYINLINQSAFITDNIRYSDIDYKELLIKNLPLMYSINNDIVDSSNQSINDSEIYYSKLFHINVLGLSNSIYFEYSNQFLRTYYLIKNNLNFLNKIIDTTSLDSTTLNSLKNTYVINDNIFTYNLYFKDINLIEIQDNTNIYSEPIRNLIFDQLNDVFNKIYTIQNQNKTDKTNTEIIDKNYLFKRNLKYIQNNIPGLNFFSDLVDSGYIESFNRIKLLDFTDNNAYEVINNNLLFIPRIILYDKDTNSTITYHNIFINSNNIYLPSSFDRYDTIIIENQFNNNKIIINRSLDNNIVNLTQIDLSINLYDDISSYPYFNQQVYGNLLFYLEKNIPWFNNNINLNDIRFNNCLNIKINKSLLGDNDSIYFSGLCINRNVNLSNSLSILNTINSYLVSRYNDIPGQLRNLSNQNNLHEFPLPIIIFRNISINAPILSKSSIDIINANFDYSNFYYDLLNNNIDIVSICNNLIDILKTHSPDNTTDINALINYKTISNNIISNNISTNSIALIFSLNFKNSQNIIPFIIYLGRSNTFVPEASLYISYTNRNINYPIQGISYITSNSAERTIFISDTSSGIYTTEISSNPTFKIVTTANNSIPIKSIEFFGINNLNSIINKITMKSYRIVDYSNRITEPITIDITNINDIYYNNRYIKYFDDEILVDQIDVTVNLSSILTGFEYIDILTFKISTNIDQYNRNVSYRYNLKYSARESINISNIIFNIEKNTLLSNSYNIIKLSPMIYNISGNLFSSLSDNKYIIIIPNINIFNNVYYDTLDYSNLIEDASSNNIDINDIFIYDIVKSSLNISKTNNILYLKNISNNENKFIRGFIKITNPDPKVIFNTINIYDNYEYPDGKIFMEGLISNFKNDEYNWNKYFKIYKILLDATVLEVLSTKNFPMEIKIKLKLYNTETDFINDTSSTIIEYIDFKTITLKSYDDFISSENTYYPRILHIIKKEDVYPEFGTPKDYVTNLQFKLKTSDTTISPISKVYLDIINVTSDVELCIPNSNSLDVMDNIQVYYNNKENVYQTNDKQEMLKYINKYILYKTSLYPNASELNFFLLIRIRPRYYGINFAGISISSFIANERISQIIPYLYITEYGTVMSIFKNNGIIHTNSNIEDNFKNILPDYIKYSNIYEYLKNHQQPIKSFGSIQLLNCTNSIKNISIVLKNNTSGKIPKLDSTKELRLGPYEFKNIKIEEDINPNDYTNNDSGIIYININNKSDDHLIDTIEIPIPSLDKYIYQISSLIDNLNLHGNSPGLKIVEFKNPNRYFTNNILINKYEYSKLNNEYINNIIPIMKNKIDIEIITKISNEDYIRCSSTINNFDNIIKSGYLSIPFDFKKLGNVMIEYKIKGKDWISFTLSELHRVISESISKKYNKSKQESDISATQEVLNNFIDIFIPGDIINNTTYIKMYFHRTDVFEQKFQINSDIFINITNPLNEYVKKYILKDNNIIFDDIDTIKIFYSIDTIDLDNIITHLFLGRDIHTTNYVYNNILNKTPNKDFDTIKKEVIEIGSNLKYKSIYINNNQYRSDDVLKTPIVLNMYSLVDKHTIYYSNYIELPEDPEECLEYYIRYKDVYERNNIYTRYILNLRHNYTDKLDFNFIPIINDYIYNNTDDNIILYVKLNDRKILSNGNFFSRKYSMENNSTLEIESLYPKIRKFSGIINNINIPTLYNSVIQKYEFGKELAIGESGLFIRPIKEMNDMELYNLSLNSNELPRYVIIKKLNTNNDVICILGLYIKKIFIGNMTLNNIEVFHNFPFDIVSYFKSLDNETYKQNNNKIVINKSISKYYNGVESFGELYITGIPNQTGEYQLIIKTNYTKINNIYNDIMELKIRIQKPESLDNEYILFRHERMDAPYISNKANFEESLEGYNIFNKYKKYKWSHIRGLCGGGGFHFEDNFQTGEQEISKSIDNELKDLLDYEE